MPTTVDALLIKLDASTERLRREMERANRTVGRSAQRMDRSLRGVSAGFASMQRSVTALIPSLGVLAGAGGFAGLALGMRAAVREAEQTERQLLKISQIIKSTGGTAQLTANQIDEFARQLARATLATSDGVRDAAGALLSFRSISGETFTRTLSLAQDLSAVMGTSLQSNILQLGKALEDPIRGITALRRSGVSFTQAQQDLIKSLAETNRLAEAQDLILGELQKQVGGAGAAEAGGLSGAVDSLAQAWSEFLEGLGNSSAISAVTGLVRGLSESVTALRLELGLFVTGREEFEALLEERFRIEAQLAQPVSGRAKAGRARLRERLAEIEFRLRELQDENLRTIKSLGDLDAAFEAPVITIRKGADAVEEAAESVDTMSRALDLIEQQFAELDMEAARKFAGLEKLGDEVGAQAEQWDDLKSAIEGWGRSFADALLDGESNFRSFANSIIRELGRIAITRTMDPVFSAFGDFVGDALSGLFPGRASGGPVSAGSPYMVGEEGPELFVPARSGAIIPNGAGMGDTVAPVYNIDARGASPGTAAALQQVMDRTTERTVALMRDMKRRGRLPEFA